MATFNLEESLAEKLKAFAAHQHRKADDILAEWVKAGLSSLEADEPVDASTNPMLRMAQRAEELGLSSGRSDISENFDAVLREVVADKVKDRENNQDG